MSLRALALDWSVDGPLGLASAVLLAGTAVVYLRTARVGRRRDRRQRLWPRVRTGCFLAGLAVLAIDVYSGIGTEADAWLSVHMLEHMVMWVVVAPLLCAGAPLRLALFATPPPQRRTLARWLHSRPVAALTGAAGSVSLFVVVVLVTHVPAVYGLTLRNPLLHELEHGLYVSTAVLVWAPQLGIDPIPRRAGPRGRLACALACTLPMAAIAVWLGNTSTAVYGHFLPAAAALHDQRVAATVMWVGCLAALGPSLLALLPRATAQRGARLFAPLHLPVGQERLP